MLNGKSGFGRGLKWRGLLIAAVAAGAMLWSSAAMATITQGDFSVFGFFQSRWSGRWGEGQSRNNATPTTFNGNGPTAAAPGVAGTSGGGSFDFNHWDLVQARQLGDIRPDYHLVKNYNFLGRFDTLILKDADFFAFYRPWYDATGTLKSKGVIAPGKDGRNFTHRELQQRFFQNSLREYYLQLNFTDNFSARVGKQQIIWSEADALSGTELTNPNDLSFHWTHFESPENLRKNLQSVKLNYLFPDFLGTANNEIEFLWIPGDFQGASSEVITGDTRLPYVVQLHTTPGDGFNQRGQPFRDRSFAQGGLTPMTPVQFGLDPNNPAGFSFFDTNVQVIDPNGPTKSVQNSEFAVRVSSLLPIGNGLQTSFIYLYEARNARLGFCTTCGPAQANIIGNKLVAGGGGGTIVQTGPGVFFHLGATPFYGPDQTPNGSKAGNLLVLLSEDFRRNHFFGLTGTYYDKDLTDIVFRYDVLYAPRVGIAISNGARAAGPGSASSWEQQTRFIVAGDRPTYIPWLSKQHTFITFQHTLTWYPNLPTNAAGCFGCWAGITREIDNFTFIAFTNWLYNGQWVATNVLGWNWDNNVGFLSSANSYRYSRNILLGANMIWYLGQSGRFTDPFVFSGNQKINELEFVFTYEI